MSTGAENPNTETEPNLGRLLEQKQPILITSNYKGIVLTQPVEVLEAKPERVIVQAPDLRVCYTVKEQVQLYSQAHQDVILARLLGVDPTMGKLELTELSFPGWPWHHRISDRVQPRDPIYVHGWYQTNALRACLDNLSAEGISLMVYQRRHKPVVFEPEALLRLSMMLPGSTDRLRLSGRVLHQRQAGKLHLVGLRLTSSSAQEKLLRRYVQARRDEIMTELEQSSRAFLARQGMPGSTSLYS